MKFLLAILTCAVTTAAGADEPWMYPVVVASSPTRAELASVTMKNSYAADSNGSRRFECTTRVVDKEVAGFQQIVKWYADKVGETELPRTLDRFVAEGRTGPGIGFFKTAPLALSTHLAFRFLPDQKHITFLHAEENGDVVAVSLLGLDRETSIQVLRHRWNPQAVVGAGGEAEPK